MLAVPVLASAQDISTEITVDRTIVPEQRSAERPAGFVPSIQLPRMELRPLSLHEYLKASPLTTIVPVLEPASYRDTIAVTPYRGYAALGYFPVYNLGASAGYRFINNHNTRLGAWLQFDGNSYKADVGDIRNSYGDNTVAVGADFNRMFRLGHLAAGLEYTHGRTSMAAPGAPVDYDNLILNTNAVKADLSWWGRCKSVIYRASFAFEHFGYDSYFSQQRYTPQIGIMLNAPSGRPSGGVDLKGDFLGDGYGQVSLKPYYGYSNNVFTAHVGLNLDVRTGDMTMSSGKKYKRFHVAPDVVLGWTPLSLFAIEARVEGGSHLNTASGYYDWCHYLMPSEVLPLSNVPVDARLQFSVGPVAGVSLKLFGCYSMADDWLLPVAGHALYPAVGNAARQPGVYTLFAPYDLKGWLLGVSVGYRWRDVVDFEATAQMAPQDPDKGYYRWLDRARYVADATLKVHPLEPLDIELGYGFRGGRAIFDGAGYKYHLSNKSDLSAGAAWHFTPQLSVWGRVENILGRHYDLLLNLPSQGIRGLVGASYKF